jgi:enoyl-CoA hydratase/carnithine racemase
MNGRSSEEHARMPTAHRRGHRRSVRRRGAILAMASDLRIGTPRSRVGFLFVRVGLSGADMGACALLPRIIGQGRASELLYTGRFMDGVEAERWGFTTPWRIRTTCWRARWRWRRQSRPDPPLRTPVTKKSLTTSGSWT